MTGSATGRNPSRPPPADQHLQFRRFPAKRRGFRPWSSLEAWRTVKSVRSEEHTSELQSLMRISYAVFCLKKKKKEKAQKTKQSYSTLIYTYANNFNKTQ